MYMETELGGRGKQPQSGNCSSYYDCDVVN